MSYMEYVLWEVMGQGDRNGSKQDYAKGEQEIVQTWNLSGDRQAQNRE